MIANRYFFLLIILIVLPAFGYGQAKSETIVGERSKGDTKLKIILKPRPVIPVLKSSTICVTGAVILRVEFLRTSEIGKITVVKGLPYGLTENSIAAARKIKFEPAKKDGKTITVFKQIDYTFGIY